jgi:hypothetical protein
MEAARSAAASLRPSHPDRAVAGLRPSHPDRPKVSNIAGDLRSAVSAGSETRAERGRRPAPSGAGAPRRAGPETRAERGPETRAEQVVTD